MDYVLCDSHSIFKCTKFDCADPCHLYEDEVYSVLMCYSLWMCCSVNLIVGPWDILVHVCLFGFL